MFLGKAQDKEKPRPYKRTRLIKTRDTTFFHRQLTLPTSRSVRQHFGACNVRYYVAAYLRICSVQSSKMYSLNASHAPLINRQLSVCSTNRYLFSSQPLFMLQLRFIIAMEGSECQLSKRKNSDTT